jgi:cell wall-associated NlpC family hydrolase
VIRQTTAVRDLPDFKDRRVVQPRTVASFATQLAGQLANPAPGNGAGGTRRSSSPTIRPGYAQSRAALDPADLIGADALSDARNAIVDRAESLLGIPYVWGGDSPRGYDCSSWLSKVWGVSRHTTDSLSKVADPITKDDLQAGDAMNLPTWKDPSGHGHVRMFDRWADPSKQTMWVYEETADTGNSVHRVIPYDARYQPMRLRGLAD